MKKIIFLILLLAIVGSVFFFRIELVQMAAPKIAGYLGVEVERVTLTRLDINAIEIDELSINSSQESSDINIEITNLIVNLDINIEGRRQVSDVSAASVSVAFQEKNNNTSIDKRSIKSQLAEIPLVNIDIDRLEIDYAVLNGDEISYHGHVEMGDTFQVDGLLTASHMPPLQIHASLINSDVTLIVEDSEKNHKVIDGEGQFFIENDWLTVVFNGDIGLSQLNQYLSPYGVETYIKEDASKIKLEFEIDVSQSIEHLANSFSSRVSVESSAQIVAKDYNIEHMQLDIRSDCFLDGFIAAECEIKHPQKAQISLIKSSNELGDYFAKPYKHFIVDVNPASSIIVKLEDTNLQNLSMKGDVIVDVMSNDRQLTSSIRFSEFSGHLINKQWVLNSSYLFDAEVNNIVRPIQVKKVVAKSRGIISADQDKVVLKMLKGERVVLLELNSEQVQIDKVDAYQIDNQELTYFLDNNKLSAQDVRYALMLKNVIHENYRLDSDVWNIDIDTLRYHNELQQLSGAIDTNEFSIYSDDQPYEFDKAQTSFMYVDDNLDISGSLFLDVIPQPLRFTANHNFVNSSGQGNADFSSVSVANNKVIEQQISQSGFPLQLKSGQVDIEIMSHWTDEKDATVKLKVSANEINGDYAQNQFKNFNTVVDVLYQDGWRLSEPAKFTVEQTNIGIPINNINADLESFEFLDTRQPMIEVSEISASVLDGSMISKDIAIDLNRPVNEFSLYLSSLSLEKLLALNQTKELIASGSFDGELPLQINNGEILINNGWIKADDKGGFIKYGKVGEVLVGNENLVMVGELLEDFRYNEMSAKVNLNSDGGLFLATKLHGRSPKAELNKQVNLNFNIEFNLWKFLESARLLMRIDQDIGEQIISNQNEK